MGHLLLLYPILCFHLLLFHFPSHSSSLEPFCNHDQSYALLQFKNSFSLNSSAFEDYCVGYQPFNPKTASWENGTSCCLWDGVTCDTMLGHVIGLDLSCRWLQGEFHPNSTLFQLPYLQTLNLAYNNFKGSSISSEFGDLVTLTHLNLSFSRFAGEIPSKISQLSKLVSLDLSWNAFYTSKIISSLRLKPSTWEKLILNATDLRELVLTYVNMSLIRPSSLSLLMNLSSSLVHLDLTETSLQGNLPNNILCLQNLEELSLSWNENLKVQLPTSNWSSPLRSLDLSNMAFSGEVPDSIGHLESLESLDLSSCQFKGAIPSSFGNLTHITYLNLGSNNFGGQIPSSLSNLQHLTTLALSQNNLYTSRTFPSLRLEPSTWEKLILNATNLRALGLSEVNMSLIRPSSLSLLMNLSSSLVYLHLTETRLQGNLPNNILSLQNLRVLSLSRNENLKVQLPTSNWSSPLRSLDLSKIAFPGQVPDSIGTLKSLEELILSYCQFKGPISPSFGNLTHLRYLNLGSNNFSGKIPNLFGKLSKLQTLILSINNLEGQLPLSLFNLTQLSDLDCSYNNLSGLVNFHQLSELRNLEALDLSNNKFLSVNFDNNVGYNFPYLYNLDFSSGNINTFPKFLERLQNLQFLNLSHNKIHGKVPKWFNNVGNNSLEYLDLSHNFLTSIEHLSWGSMQFLDLSSNMLKGNLPIPPFGVEFFSVSNNELTGNISFSICNASSLVILNLSHNNLTGLIPQCLVAFPNLLVLDLQTNNLVGTTPRNFSKNNSLQTLHFNSNQLEGPLPLSMYHCKQLEILDLGHNKIEDAFPNWLEDLQELQVLVLRANKFHGPISSSNTKHPFPKLRIFDVSNNHFSGSLPTSYIKKFKGMMNEDDGVAGLKYMTNENYSSYKDSVMVTMKGIDIELVTITTTFTTIDLSNNMFDGKIPKVIGELYSLKGLNLSHNRIIGSIPQSLGELKNLEWLDLSSNKLVGEIPLALTNLNFLSTLNLSQNQLEGIIPRGKQFDTFQNDSYEGNLGLCGIPLSKTCSQEDRELPPSSSNLHDDEESGFGWKAVALGYACGMVFGVLMGYIVFSTGKPHWLTKIVEDEHNKRAKRTKRKN